MAHSVHRELTDKWSIFGPMNKVALINLSPFKNCHEWPDDIKPESNRKLQVTCYIVAPSTMKFIMRFSINSDLLHYFIRAFQFYLVLKFTFVTNCESYTLRCHWSELCLGSRRWYQFVAGPEDIGPLCMPLGGVAAILVLYRIIWLGRGRHSRYAAHGRRMTASGPERKSGIVANEEIFRPTTSRGLR